MFVKEEEEEEKKACHYFTDVQSFLIRIFPHR
jgi:hypothetical protein